MKAISKRTRFEVFKRDSFKCQHCGKSSPDVVLHVDHIKPRASGGTNDLLNLVTACDTCNLGKSDKELSDSSAVAKQKAQLDALNERREQLEMLIEWKSALAGLDTMAARGVCDVLYRCFGHESGPEVVPVEIVTAVRKFGVDVCMDATKRAADAYTTAEHAIGKFGGICNVIKKGKSDPHYETVVRIRACLKRSGKYVNEGCFSKLVRAALDRNASVESLIDCAYKSRSWTAFVNDVSRFINNQDASRNASEGE